MNVDQMRIIADAWKQAQYYEDAENWLAGFWDSKSDFRRMFETIDRRSLLELACGHGRHAAYILDCQSYVDLGHLYLMDVNKENIEICRKRFLGEQKVSLLLNSGTDFTGVDSKSVTGIYCYDAMVHFEYDTVLAYIKDAARVLVPGGRALFHHSNYDKMPGSTYFDHPGGRNYMSKGLFAHAAIRSGFRVEEQLVMTWAGSPDCDCLTLLESNRS